MPSHQEALALEGSAEGLVRSSSTASSAVAPGVTLPASDGDRAVSRGIPCEEDNIEYLDEPPPRLLSSDGQYELEVRHRLPRRILIRRTGTTPPFELDPNPHGTTNNCAVRFVGGANVLVSWSCGSQCSVGVLFAPSGKLLVSMSFVDVSPSLNLAVDFDPGFPVSGHVGLVDLRTGARLYDDNDNRSIVRACGVKWRRDSVLLSRCDSSATALSLDFDPRLKSI